MTAAAARLHGRTAGPGRLLEVSHTAGDGLRPLTVASVGVAVAGPVFAVTGVPPIPLMWPLYRVGVVLPGCGLTRGLVALAGGDVAAAWRWNPASFLVALVVVLGLARAVGARASGRWVQVRVEWRWWLVALSAGAVGALWINQWSHAQVLMGRA